MLYQNLTKHLAQKLQLTLSRQHLFCFNVSQDKIFYFYKLFVKFSDNWNDTQIFELSLDCFFYKHHLFLFWTQNGDCFVKIFLTHLWMKYFWVDCCWWKSLLFYLLFSNSCTSRTLRLAVDSVEIFRIFKCCFTLLKTNNMMLLLSRTKNTLLIVLWITSTNTR